VENDKKFESVYSSKVRAGKRRTYFFDVRQTKGEDYYITITESTRRFDGNGYERHKIFLYKEDFNRFMSNLNDTVNHVKTELMPDFDYEMYEKRQEEWEEKMRLEALEAQNNPTEEAPAATETEVTEEAPTPDSTDSTDTTSSDTANSADEDISW